MDDNYILGQPLEEGMPPVEQTLSDISYEPVTHRYDHIVGNELRCSLHGGMCSSVFISPTQVLEEGEDGQLYLVDKAP